MGIHEVFDTLLTPLGFIDVNGQLAVGGEQLASGLLALLPQVLKAPHGLTSLASGFGVN